MILQSNKLGTSYIHNNSPTPLWKIARVPSARATNTIPFTCLQQEKGFQDSPFGNAGGTTCYWTSSQALRGPIHDIPDIPEPKDFFFLSHLYAQCGAQSHDPKMRSHILYTDPARRPRTHSSWESLAMKMSAELNKKPVQTFLFHFLAPSCSCHRRATDTREVP